MDYVKAFQLMAADSLKITDNNLQPINPNQQIEFAIRCLEAALKLPNTAIQQLELYFSLAYSYHHYTMNSSLVEQYLTKANLIISNSNYQSNEFLTYGFRIMDLRFHFHLSQNHHNIARNIIKKAISRSSQNSHWQSHFLLLKLKVSTDWQSYLQASTEVVEQLLSLKNYSHAYIVLLLRIQRSFQSEKLIVVESIFKALDNMKSKDESLTLNANLNITYLILKINYYCQIGKNHEAVDMLTALHGLLETQYRDENKYETIMYFQPTMLFLLTYLISGIVHKPIDNMKSKTFLTQGLKAVNKEISKSIELNDPCQLVHRRHYLVRLKSLLLIQVFEIQLIRCDYLAAFKTIYYCTEFLLPFAEVWQELKDYVMLDWGMLFQSLEDYDKSDVIYQKLLSSSNQNLAWFVKAHLYIRSTQREVSGDMLKELIETRDSSSLTQMLIKTILCSYDTLNKNEFKATKGHLLEAIKMKSSIPNVQITGLCLNILGSLYMDTDKQQSKKIFDTCLAFTKKSGSLMTQTSTLSKLEFLNQEYSSELKDSKTVLDSSKRTTLESLHKLIQ
ncbi:hypothetical protein BC833DRAFT_544840 [Globomyces pollinis-pini]|nr:hypothetical protein BC833DRAFT_544840 [Globomyces pollinis-pini]